MVNWKRHYQKRVILIMILVTGATGFLGRNLILSLSEKKDNIIGQFREKKNLTKQEIFLLQIIKKKFSIKLFGKKLILLIFLKYKVYSIKLMKFTIVQLTFQWHYIKPIT